MFAYELPKNSFLSDKVTFGEEVKQLFKKLTDSIVVYNFHNLTLQDRYFFFAINKITSLVGLGLSSISELFPNSSWLEREIHELHGVGFGNKKDTRNLMLQYGDTTVPFQKTSPSIGYKELFYDSLNDVVVEVPVSITS
jgi:NADH:ubiquinone oxidoreductase subunit C